jgi:hypothetical protein
MRVAASILAILCVCAAPAQEQKKATTRPFLTPPHFYKAEDFIDLSEADRMLYTTGLIDGFSASAMFGATNGTISNLTACTKDMDAKQISAIITKYVKDHPEAWHYPISIEAYNALTAACPGQLKIVD